MACENRTRVSYTEIEGVACDRVSYVAVLLWGTSQHSIGNRHEQKNLTITCKAYPRLTAKVVGSSLAKICIQFGIKKYVWGIRFTGRNICSPDSISKDGPDFPYM